MAQLSDDCFAFGGELLRAEEALKLLRERLDVVAGIETVALSAAAGRILAEDVVSDRAVPPHDNAAVDGYAVRFADLEEGAETRLRVMGRVAAGETLGRAVAPGKAVRIFTGAPMPEGADTVLMQEDCARDGDDVTIPPGIKRGANRRLAGEDIEAGTVILRTGTRMRPQEVGLAASVGRSTLGVFEPLKVALFSTGDEVRDAGETLPPGCIYDANRYSVGAALGALGCTVSDLGILPDRLDVVRDTLAEAARSHDLIMTSGGVSTGEEDHVRAAIEAQGSIHFWRLAIRPGRPLALGQIRHGNRNVPFVGLPGNPVAVLVTFMRFARPAILRLAGCKDLEPVFYRVRTDFPVKKKLGRREWLRVSLDRDESGEPVVRKFPRDGAGILTSMVAADGLVELPEDLTRLEAGNMVDFLPFSEVG